MIAPHAAVLAQASGQLEKLRQSDKRQRDKERFCRPVIAKSSQLIDDDGNFINVEHGKAHDDSECDAKEPNQIAEPHHIPQVFRLAVRNFLRRKLKKTGNPDKRRVSLIQPFPPPTGGDCEA